MTTEEKLQECIAILELMCKPDKLCSPVELAEIERYIGEDQMAYDTLVRIGAQPSWHRPSAERAKPHLHLVFTDTARYKNNFKY